MCIYFIVYITGADVRAVNSEGNTALHLAVSNEKLTAECLELLLKGG